MGKKTLYEWRHLTQLFFSDTKWNYNLPWLQLGCFLSLKSLLDADLNPISLDWKWKCVNSTRDNCQHIQQIYFGEHVNLLKVNGHFLGESYNFDGKSDHWWRSIITLGKPLNTKTSWHGSDPQLKSLQKQDGFHWKLYESRMAFVESSTKAGWLSLKALRKQDGFRWKQDGFRWKLYY